MWRKLSWPDRIAFFYVAFCGLAWLLRLGARMILPAGWLLFLFLVALGYLTVRLMPWVRSRLLWSLRNRLIVAYLFIAVVPVILLLAMVGISGYLLYFQLGAHLLHDDVNGRIAQLAGVAGALDTSLETEIERGQPLDLKAFLAPPGAEALLASARRNLPGLQIDVAGDAGLSGAQAAAPFAGLVQVGKGVWFEAIAPLEGVSPRRRLVLRAPVTPELLDGLAPDLGPIQFTALRPARESDQRGLILTINGQQLVPASRVASRRPMPPRSGWYDIRVNGISTFDAAGIKNGAPSRKTARVVATFSLRPSMINHRLFASLGALGGPLVILLLVIGVVFLGIEVAALVTGIVLTRTITRAVAGLYEATAHVRRGDFRHRIRVERRDQLGVLAQSFNAMTGSVSELIEEQRQRQRLENELAIAREVQSQLFPQRLPVIPGLEMAAICRAARVVSGDYYDFVQLGSSRIAMAIADISGKGISAALLMASLQAALRGQAIEDHHGGTAEVVEHLNRHLFLNTSDDRYATLFYAEYDAATHRLCYTNAGHLAPFYLVGEEVTRLEEGGTVVGLFESADYAQASVPAKPGGLFVGFSDGLVEPENVYGEEFGSTRLAGEVLRHRESSAELLAESLLAAAEQWAGSPERPDDMTVIVARFH